MTAQCYSDTFLDRLARLGARPVSAASAAAFRIAFGLLGIVAVIRFGAKGWISEIYIQPAHHFTYSGFWWIQPWPEWGMYAHFVLLGLSSLCVALGFKYRISIAAFFLLFTYVELIDKTTYLNHYYWVSLVSLLMIFMPLDRYASVDAWRDPKLRSASVPVWVVCALRAQVGVVYVFGGVAKLNPDWAVSCAATGNLAVQQRRPAGGRDAAGRDVGGLRNEHGRSPVRPDRRRLASVGTKQASRVRCAVRVSCCDMDAFFPIGMFPWIMMCASLIFFSPNWPRALVERFGLSTGADAAVGTFEHPQHSWTGRIATAALLTFALVQLMAPLRHWIYPGNVRWNEDAYRFSWRVMLTEKTGHVRFRVTDSETGREWLAYPEGLSDSSAGGANGLPA